MAVEVRKTWAQLKTEHLDRSRQSSDANYDSRAEDFLTQATFDIGRLFKHRIQDEEDTTLVFDLTSLSYALPVDHQTVIALKIVDPDSGKIAKILTPVSFASVIAAQQDEHDGLPQKMAIYKESLHFDKIADKLYTTTLYYQTIPTAPDFATGVPVTERVWDAHILEWSLVLSGFSTGESDVARGALQALQFFLQTTPDSPLKALQLTAPQHDENDLVGGAGL